MAYFISIDPGLTGAVAILVDDGNSIEVKVHDAPTKQKSIKSKKKSTKREFDIQKMVEILKPYIGRTSFVMLEAVHSMPGQGSVGNFSFGEGLGIWKGVIVALGFEVKSVTPQSWKKEYGEHLIQPHVDKPDEIDISEAEYDNLSLKSRKMYAEAKKQYNNEKRLTKEKAKEAARILASQLYPKVSDQLLLKKHDGRAEAILMAEAERRRHANNTEVKNAI